MSDDGLQGLENVLAGFFAAAGGRLAAAGDPAGGPEPVPQVTGKPAAVTAAPPWTAPQPAGGGQVTVSRDVLRSVAAAMRSELATLD